MGRPALITKEKIIQAMPGTHGLINNVAKKMGVTYSSLYDFMQKQEDRTWFDVLLKKEQEKICDLAEDSLFEGIANGNAKDRNFYLRTKGRDRGYVTKTENEVSGEMTGSAIINVIVRPDAEVKKEAEKK